MRSTITLLLLFIISSINAQSFKNPVDYLNYISKESSNISRSTWKYTQAVAHSKNARRIDATRKQLIKTIQASTKKLSALDNGYNGDVEFRDLLLSYFSLVEKSLNNEYDKIIDMQEVAEQSYDAMEMYIMTRDMVNAKMSRENDKVQNGQKIFANKYHIQISDEETELSKKMEVSREVFNNHSIIYLIFFKANITESNLMHAIGAKDMNAIQQNTNALAQFAAEGHIKLSEYIPYKNDQMLVNATKKYLDFCAKESAEMTPAVVSFLMLNQKLEDQKAIMDKKKAGDRSTEEINNFNALVNSVNKEIGNYNKLNTKFYNDRVASVTNWNNTSANFISKHVPVD